MTGSLAQIYKYKISLIRVSHKIGMYANKEYRLLSFQDRKKLAVSGLNEIERFNLESSTKECFALLDEDKGNDKKIIFDDLKQVFEYFEKYIDMK